MLAIYSVKESRCSSCERLFNKQPKRSLSSRKVDAPPVGDRFSSFRRSYFSMRFAHNAKNITARQAYMTKQFSPQRKFTEAVHATTRKSCHSSDRIYARAVRKEEARGEQCRGITCHSRDATHVVKRYTQQGLDRYSSRFSRSSEPGIAIAGYSERHEDTSRLL